MDDRLSDEEFLEFMYHIKRILNSSVKTNVDKNYHNVSIKASHQHGPSCHNSSHCSSVS